jgi:peptidoglycan/xylan/chitin deacetylase (PgdA/CDA1 family)
MALNICQFFFDVSGYWYLGVGLVYWTIISIGSFRVDSQFHFYVTCKGTKKKGVVLSFDDGPNPEVTPALLDLLKKYDIKALFFLIGKNAEAHPELVKRIVDEGHVIGNHTFSHSYYFDFWFPKKMSKDIDRCTQLLRTLTGKRTFWFRPPYGVTNPMMKKALGKSWLAPIGWSVRSLDTVIRDRTKLMKRISKAVPGDIILLHDNRPDCPQIVEELIHYLTAKNIPFVHPEQEIGMSAYHEN